MRYAGSLNEWNDERGFGFVTPHGGGPRAFVHIKAFERGAGRPVAGMRVSYELARDGQGRLTASRLRRAEPSRSGARMAPRQRPGSPLAFSFLTLLLVGWLLARLPGIVVLAYGGMSGVATLLYGWDKAAARNNRWRTRESTLHLISLAGGWPGALLAQQFFRHKSLKAEFQTVFRATVLLNCAGLAWLLASGKAAAIQQMFSHAAAGA